MSTDNHLGVDLATFSNAEVEERIREYCGAGPNATIDYSRVTKVMKAIFRLTPEERSEFLNALPAFYCRHCGSGFLPCHCWNDE